MKSATARRPPFLRLLFLTAAALVIHGYHLGVEDGEIYVPAAKKLLHPDLYPYGTEFFRSHERLSIFAPILAWTASLVHIPMDWTIFLWYIASIFITLISCWMLAAVSFRSARARWCAVLVITTLLAMPATNTGLLLMDPYLTARSFSTPLTLLALVAILERRFWVATVLAILTAAIHPQMAAYLVFLGGVMWLAEYLKRPVASETSSSPATAVMLAVLPATFQLGPAQEPYREALYSRDFYFLSTWTWYQWLGLLAPLAILAWFWKGNLRNTTLEFRRLSFALIPFGIVSILAGAAIAGTHQLDMYARLQPLRCFHLITFVFMLFFAGVLGEYLAKDRLWVIPMFCVPLAAGMFVVARETYPHSPLIEIPGSVDRADAWIATLDWIRRNTPKDAVFAVDSRYFEEPEVDVHGFRALSERSTLADYYKDGGVVAMFPRLAVPWKQMSNATYGLNHFSAADFMRLAHQYPVSWAVIHGAAPAGMSCPYQQRGYAVCEIAGAPGLGSPSRSEMQP